MDDDEDLANYEKYVKMREKEMIASRPADYEENPPGKDQLHGYLDIEWNSNPLPMIRPALVGGREEPLWT